MALMAVAEVLEKINTEAKNHKKYPHVRDCTGMAVFDWTRQGDVYVAKIGDVSLLTIPESPDYLIERDVTMETWPGSRHKIVLPVMHGGAKCDADRGHATLSKNLVYKLLERSPELAESFRGLRPVAQYVFALAPWRVEHHEHALEKYAEGIFVVTRQLDLATRQFVLD